MNKSLFLVVILVVVFTGVVLFLGDRGNNTGSLQATPTPMPEANQQIAGVPKTAVINITDNSFEPSEVMINAGDMVRFVNQGSRLIRPASAVHPTHQAYPGSDIKKCGTDEANLIFDACRGLQNGESFSFIFKERGTWFFHDHLDSSLRGSIIVK